MRLRSPSSTLQPTGPTCFRQEPKSDPYRQACRRRRGALKLGDVSKEAARFRKSLQKPSLNARAYLFETLPQMFPEGPLSSVLAQVTAARQELAGAKMRLSARLMQELAALFGHDVQAETSLGSALADWREGLSPKARQHVFSGTAQAMLDIVLTPPAGDLQTLEALARAVLGLRMNDWDDGKASLFLERVRAAKAEIEAQEERGEQRVDVDAPTEAGTQEDYFISYLDAAGQKQQKAFH